MPEVLILCAHRPGRSPSQRYRFEQYTPFLEQNGFRFTVSFLLDEADDLTFYSKGNFLAKVLILIRSVGIRLKDLRRYKRYDIVFIQREALFLGSSFFERAAAGKGIPVIFDFDDSIWLADTSPGNKKWEWIKKPDKFFDNVRVASLVIAGNRYLAEKAARLNANTVIIPTTVDTTLWVPKPELRGKERTVIGWSGSISTIKHFESLVPALLKIKDLYKDRVAFKILGDPLYHHPVLKPAVFDWSQAGEVEHLNSFDIGVMPLPDDEWANGKCGLKALTYMSCGVATVASPVGVNTEIIQHGVNGMLASTEEEWVAHISGLIENRELRYRLGEAARATVTEKYSVAANKNKYLAAFRSVEPSR